MAGTLINIHNIHNLWSPQKCAGVNQPLCVELRHLLNRVCRHVFLYATLTSHLVARDQKPQKLTQLYTRYIFHVLLSFATVLAIKGLAAVYHKHVYHNRLDPFGSILQSLYYMNTNSCK